MGKFKSTIFEGRVLHQRLRPQKHRLIYNVFNLLIDLEELPSLSKQMTLFSHNKLNFFSFWDKDHGLGQDRPLISYVREVLIKAGLDCQNGPVKLLCYPRLFGYVFNPLSVYYCYNQYEASRKPSSRKFVDTRAMYEKKDLVNGNLDICYYCLKHTQEYK